MATGAAVFGEVPSEPIASLTTLLVQGLAAKSHTVSSSDDCSSSGRVSGEESAKWVADGLDVEVSAKWVADPQNGLRVGDVTPDTTLPKDIGGVAADVLLVACRVTPPKEIGGARLDALLIR